MLDFLQSLFAAKNSKNSPEKEINAPVMPVQDFEFNVQDAFTIKGRGTVVTGEVTFGIAQVGQSVQIKSESGMPVISKITGIEAFRKQLTQAKAGEKVGLVLESVSQDKVAKGSIITQA